MSYYATHFTIFVKQTDMMGSIIMITHPSAGGVDVVPPIDRSIYYIFTPHK